VKNGWRTAVVILSTAVISLAGVWFAFGQGVASKDEVQTVEVELGERMNRMEDRIYEQLRDLNVKVDRILERSP
jgi:hypothetical protein